MTRTVEQQNARADPVVRSTEKETLYISLPCGIDHGEVIALKGKGHVNVDGECGDVRIKVCVTNDTAFERVGLDLLVSKPISLKEALCGFVFTLRHVSGKLCTVKNHDAVVTSGHEQRIPQLGMTRGDRTGHLVIKFHVEFPLQLSEEQKQTLRETL